MRQRPRWPRKSWMVRSTGDGSWSSNQRRVGLRPGSGRGTGFGKSCAEQRPRREYPAGDHERRPALGGVRDDQGWARDPAPQVRVVAGAGHRQRDRARAQVRDLEHDLRAAGGEDLHVGGGEPLSGGAGTAHHRNRGRAVSMDMGPGPARVSRRTHSGTLEGPFGALADSKPSWRRATTRPRNWALEADARSSPRALPATTPSPVPYARESGIVGQLQPVDEVPGEGIRATDRPLATRTEGLEHARLPDPGKRRRVDALREQDRETPPRQAVPQRSSGRVGVPTGLHQRAERRRGVRSARQIPERLHHDRRCAARKRRRGVCPVRELVPARPGERRCPQALAPPDHLRLGPAFGRGTAAWEPRRLARRIHGAEPATGVLVGRRAGRHEGGQREEDTARPPRRAEPMARLTPAIRLRPGLHPTEPRRSSSHPAPPSSRRRSSPRLPSCAGCA